MEEWQPIAGFPNYSIGSEGHVRNDASGRLLAVSVNQYGVLSACLHRGARQYRRSVPLLVAEAFVDRGLNNSGSFDTPINLDGDRLNNRAENLAWRPRWFAVKYTQQFHIPRRGFTVPIEEVESKEQFDTSWDAAIKYGLLDIDIVVSTQNRTYVWPTYQRFRVL